MVGAGQSERERAHLLGLVLTDAWRSGPGKPRPAAADREMKGGAVGLAPENPPSFSPRSFIVRMTCSLIAAAVLAAVVVAGCGGEEETKVDLSKKTDTTQFKGMMDDMKGNIKAKK
jgi:hypothetical protein